MVTALSLIAASASAQSVVIKPQAAAASEVKPFSNLSIGLSAGTTGIGLEATTPITSWLDMRAGVSWMPQFNIPMTFGLETFDVEGVNTNKFADLQQMLSEQMGIDMDDKIDMNAKSTMVDFKFMLDFYPIPNNKHWSVTAGFYWGNSKVGHIENDILDSPTLVGVVVYNTMYQYFVDRKYWYEPLFGTIDLDIELGDEVRERFLRYGRMGVHLGNFKDTGDPYIMVPDDNCMVKANMYVNHFKPYLGAGYHTTFGKEKRWKFSTQLGVLFWGGTPDIKTHANLNMEDNPTVNLTKEVDDIHGKVGDYVKFVKHLKVYPSLNFSISYTIF